MVLYVIGACLKKCIKMLWKSLAIQGLEPWTFALLARRSNQLSYTAGTDFAFALFLKMIDLQVKYPSKHRAKENGEEMKVRHRNEI